MRKPGSLMIEKAMAKYNIQPDTSWMIGDALRDMQAGRRAGVRTVRIAHSTATDLLDSERCVTDLLEASHYVLSQG
jgi:D-glycero-D-manno-heptose 1,7-bisphosphate phosphatase